LVRPSPFGDEALGGRRECAGDDRKGLDIDGCLVLAMAGVEVRTSKMMNLIVIHLDRNSIEKTDPRHGWPPLEWSRRTYAALWTVQSISALYFDDHAPPHFHARAAEHNAKIQIDTLEVIASDLRRRERSRAA
jgi:hypothetical protein